MLGRPLIAAADPMPETRKYSRVESPPLMLSTARFFVESHTSAAGAKVHEVLAGVVHAPTVHCSCRSSSASVRRSGSWNAYAYPMTCADPYSVPLDIGTRGINDAATVQLRLVPAQFWTPASKTQIAK